MKKETIYYILICLLFVGCKVMYTFSSVDNLNFLLAPINSIIELLTNQQAQYIVTQGYYYENLNIIINKDCSGLNFWILCFTMISFQFINQNKKGENRLKVLGILVFVSYLFTILVNASRILVSIMLSEKYPSAHSKHKWVHEAEGIFIYLSFLILLYYSIHFLITKSVKPNEKLA
jgi:exosortase K